MAPETLKRLIGALLPSRAPAPPPANRIVFDQQPAVIYAVGDIHGCLDLLKELEAKIAEDAAGVEGQGWLVSLGDGVDRGPSTAQVIDHLRGPAPAGLKRLNLMGNHEAMMLDFIRRPRGDSSWIGTNGGAAAMMSYGVPAEVLANLTTFTAGEIVDRYIPKHHIEYLSALPVMLETPSAIFVHAGMRPGVTIPNQSDDDLLWYRDEYREDFAEFGKVVVHGHTPRDTPLVSPSRIAVDTGAVLTGQLTAVRITPSGPPELLATPRRPMPRKGAAS